LSTLPPLLVAEEIEKHRLPVRVNPSPPKVPDVMHNWGSDGEDASVMVPPRLVPLSVLPRNDSEPPVNVMFVDESHGPEVAVSVRVRLAKKLNLDDAGANVSAVEPERPSLHRVEKMLEHDVAVWGGMVELDGPPGPVDEATPGDGVPPPPVGVLMVPGVTDADTGPDAAKSLLTVGT
jgi:hypothetical protein